MHPILKSIVVIIVGIALGIATIALLEGFSHQVIPMPQNIDFKDPAQLATYMTHVPFIGKLLVVVAWGLGMFFGAAVAVKFLDGKKWPATVVVLFLLGATSINFVMIPHPIWMIVAAVVAAAVAWMEATRLFATKKPK